MILDAVLKFKKWVMSILQCKRETDKKVACFVLKNISTSKRNIFSVLDELKNLRSQSTCSQSCDPNGCIQIGTEPYSAVYKAICKSETLIA